MITWGNWKESNEDLRDPPYIYKAERKSFKIRRSLLLHAEYAVKSKVKMIPLLNYATTQVPTLREWN
jgi:hypothetical protein